jgi:hypothetical protein
MAVLTYLRGSVIKLNVVVRNEVSTVVDPADLTLEIKKPDGSTSSFSYPSTISRDGVGCYSVDYTCDQGGRHFYRWESTGPAGADEHQFIVNTGSFA